MLGYDSPESVIQSITSIGDQIFVRADKRETSTRYSCRLSVFTGAANTKALGWDWRFVEKSRNGGAITAQSHPGEGATFVVTLPMRQTVPAGDKMSDCLTAL